MRIAALVGALALQAACVQFSPFETDLDADERDLTAKNLELLARRGMPEVVKLAVIADSHADYDELRELVAILDARADIDLVLHAGDLTDFGLRQEYLWSLEQLRQLRSPWLTVIGNHDAISNGSEVYREMFGAYDYAFDFGHARFICFNSNPLEFDDDVPRWDFVEAEAQAAADRKLVLLTHQPLANPAARLNESLSRLVHEGNLLVMLHGHLHAPSVRWIDDVPAIIVGSSERLSYAIVTIDAAQASVEICSGRSCSPLEPAP